jgi:hypothetical protein
MRRALDDDASAAALVFEGARDGLVIHVRSEAGWARAVELTRAASAAGIAPIGLVSAGAPSPRDLAELVRAGARELGLALHGARREVHDWHVGSDGAFAQTLEGIGAARALGMDVGVTTEVTRSNARVLSELPSLLRASGVTLWALRPAVARREPFTATVPRLGLGVPPMLAALERATRLGLVVRTSGFPACVLGPFARTALPSRARHHGGVCQACAARPSCPGVDGAYLERFGEGELRALDAAVRADPATSLATLFEER